MFIIISLSCPRFFKQGNNLLNNQSSLKRDRGGKLYLPSPTYPDEHIGKRMQ